ncbi:MAG: ADP-ribosyltransferase domain-containing protein [Pseudomonadota bacterium]
MPVSAEIVDLETGDVVELGADEFDKLGRLIEEYIRSDGRMGEDTRELVGFLFEILPGTGEVISAVDAIDAFAIAVSALADGDTDRALDNLLRGTISTLGAVPLLGPGVRLTKGVLKLLPGMRNLVRRMRGLDEVADALNDQALRLGINIVAAGNRRMLDGGTQAEGDLEQIPQSSTPESTDDTPPRLVGLSDEGVEAFMTSHARSLAVKAGGPFSSLTDPQAYALHVYTRRPLDPFTLNGEQVAVSIHDELNSAKRGLIPMTDALSSFSDDLESALLSLPTTGQQTFYRVASLPDALIEEIRLKGSIDDAAFMSASLLEDRALTYTGNVYMKIEASSARYFSPMAFNPLDEEVLFLPKTRFIVTEFVEGGGPEGRLLIKLREVVE